MPYYRIIIWTKERKAPYQGIRFDSQADINVVFQVVRYKAANQFGSNMIDVEVQMLSKLCSAVRDHMSNYEDNKRKMT